MERETIQRKKILDVIKRLHHSTVDDIFNETKKEISTLSFSTVYRNVEILENEGLIRRVPNKCSKDIFETTDLPLHDHFICNKCKNIFDYPSEHKHYKTYDKSGNLILETAKISYGICKDCLDKNS